MIENNIVKALGAGSGIDTQSLVKQLTEIERLAPQQRIDTKREKTEAQISDFGLLASAMDTLKSSFSALTNPEGLFSKSASYTDSNALVPTKLDTDVQTGSYTFEVNSIAQSQALTFGAFSSTDQAVGEGELTFNFGDWNRSVTARPDDSDYFPVDTFVADPEAESFSVTIDSSNNTLEGLKDAINDADMGVQASIIFDGSNYRLAVRAPSGANNELEITATEAGGGDNTDYSGLSQFSFNTSMVDTSYQDFENQIGADANLFLNGLEVTRETNTVDDLVEGLTLDVLKAAPGDPVTVTITDDKAFAEQNVRDFVAAYNTFLEEIEPLFGYNEEEERDGGLASDSLAKSVLSRFRGLISASVPGLTDSDFTALTNLGIRTELDGTLSIDEEDFSDAFSNRFEDVQKLFTPHNSSSSPDITVNNYGNLTQAGNYDVQISQAPAQGFLAGTTGITPVLDTTTKTYTFTVSVDGTTSDVLSIPTGITYTSVAELAEAMEVAINADSNLSDANAEVSVEFDADSDGFVITSSKWGASSSVALSGVSADMTNDMGLSDGTGTAGINVAGTINGVAGFGYGNVLLPAIGEDGEGLSLIIGPNATSGTVDFSRGFAGQFEKTIETFLQSNGLFDKHEDILDNKLEDLDDQEERLDRRMSAFEERLIRQFIAMEQIINGLNSSGGFLENLVDTLPFTAKRD